jgi:cytochrome P450
VLLRELVKQTDDKEYIRSELANIFFPARDTAAMLTTNVIFMVARRPEVWDKLRAEVLAIGDAELTFELLKTLKYTHAVMNESK